MSDQPPAADFPTADEGFAGAFPSDHVGQEGDGNADGFFAADATDAFAAPADSGFGSADDVGFDGSPSADEFDAPADEGFVARREPTDFEEASYSAPGFSADSGGEFSAGGDTRGSFDYSASGGEEEVKLDSASDTKLAEFTAKFREECEAKDREEQDAIAQRKAAAQDALRAHFDEKSRNLMTRKEHNRSLERDKEAEMEAALQGESWHRVGGLVDLSVAESGTEDVSRMKNVLITLKDKPLPPATAM